MSSKIPITTSPSRSSSSRHNAIRSHFQHLYSESPSFYIRAPGRVNLIGEHIDYSGYSVLPIAIEKDTIIAVANAKSQVNKEGEIQVANTESKKYGTRSFANLQQLGAIDRLKHDWTNYVQCGMAGFIQQHNQLHTNRTITQTPSLRVLVDGTIPLSSGLSSSSSLVCASALAICHSLSLTSLYTPASLATLCAASEQLIGTCGGGMDQSASFLSQADKQVVLISFHSKSPKFYYPLPQYS